MIKCASMNLEEGFDLVKLSKLTSQQIDHITCLECCKYYIAPATAGCGHTLCHNCWRGRKSCPLCTLPVERKQIKPNQPLQKLTEHVQSLGEVFEKLFNIKLDEFLPETCELESENDPTKNVTDWLASSQNQFSVPVVSSDQSSQDLKQNPNPVQISSSKIQVHTATRKTISPEKVVHVLPQDDWDKIEIMPDTELLTKNKENVIGPMDLEPFFIDDNEYTVNKPRRSSRKRELKNNYANFNTNNINSLEKENPIDSSYTDHLNGDMDKKSTNTKQNWNNVKKMRKEFSKLNKITRNKLNVSIEMCKKTQNSFKPNVVLQNTNTAQVYDIDENTPKQTTNDLPDVETTEVVSSKHNDHNHDNDYLANSKEKAKDAVSNIKGIGNNNIPNQLSTCMSQSVLDDHTQQTLKSSPVKNTRLQTGKPVNEKQVRMPFYKKSALYTTPNVSHQSDQVQKETNPTKIINHNMESNSNVDDDIEITIKVGNTITNIVIKKKNDVQLKVNTDREVQTSICPPEDMHPSPQNIEMKNVSINIDSKNKVNIEQKQITQKIKKQENIEHKIPETKKSVPSLQSTSKKNTASADTGTGQFEITESVEKELSNIMECAEIEEKQTTKSVPITEKVTEKDHSLKYQLNPEKTSQKNKHKTQALKNTQKTNTLNPVHQEDLSYLNDLDIFESDTVKETTNVQLLKYAKNTTPSEILISTAHNRNKTQKANEKRDRGDTNEDMPASKKRKINKHDKIEMNITADLSKYKHNQPNSESLNYDSIIGQVFASIDADIDEYKSQNVVSQMLGGNSKNIYVQDKATGDKTKSKSTQNTVEISQNHDAISVIDCTLKNNDFYNQKDSENVFSVCVEKDVVEASAPKIDKVDLHHNMDDFLTPVMSENKEATGVALVESQVNEIVNDDSESVVEDTPQKNTSLGKIKQKSIIGANNLNLSQRINVNEPMVSTGISSSTEKNMTVVNLLDTSESRTNNNETVIDTARKTTLETPLTINKFVNHIQHNSTPVARKSLNFENENLDDPEQTLCPTSDAVAKTTQELEFMRKAFEKTPTTQAVRESRTRVNKRFCIAGSCLSPGEVARLKHLCSIYNWSYNNMYTSDLTHLVVGVDEENKSQRSVKYMRALAASKWIVSNEWVDKCLETKSIVGEEKYEVLDNTGEPGPRRSRVANKKLFHGIKFFCMEPFSVLDMKTLKEMLESSGGRVVSEVKEVMVTDKTEAPALLLAEQESTQDDRFIYLAMELSIVPVNYEWVLNCLGSYSICSVQDLLLCPSSILPKATAQWPPELMACEED